MKKILLLAVVAITALSAMADLNGNGYYRLQNAVTKRYTYLLDNKGKIDASTSSVDVGALELWLGFTKASTDPASVFYVKNEGGSNYNIFGQGTDMYSFLATYMKLLDAGNYDGQKSYYVYATKSGMTKYLGDNRSDPEQANGYPSVEATGDRRKWYIHPVATGNDDFFGVAPTVTAGGKYYMPFFASFPFNAASTGLKFYTVTRVEPKYGIAIITELTGGVPGGTPVIVECAGPLAADNKFNVGANATSSVAGNQLKGVYFDNSSNTHFNRTPYNKSTMRSLGVVDGKLAFVRSNNDYIPRNEAYLQLPNTSEATSVDNYVLMTQAEYDQYLEQEVNAVPEGYYRIQNAGTKDYAYILDNSGSSTDATAIQLFADLTKANSDPASVMYVTKPENGGIHARMISAQGTNTTHIFGNTLQLATADEVDGVQSYYLATKSGTLGETGGKAAVGVSGKDAMWYFNTISESGDNYFGVAPTLTAGGKYYAPFMADFALTAQSAGMKFYTVSKVDSELEAMILSPVEGVIPAGTPVIVECSNPLASDNRLIVGASGTAANIKDNRLRGVYFNFAEGSHVNRTPYDASSMRSLAVVDGKLVFAPSTDEFVARNQAYITLNNAAEKDVENYTLMSAEEYEAYKAAVADELANGYYRMQNVETKRNLFLLSNKGDVKSPTNSNLGAFMLYSDIAKAASDPASVFSFTKNSGSSNVPAWTVSCQTVSLSSVISSNLKLLPLGEIDGENAFNAYIYKNNEKIYFSDVNASTEGEGNLTTNPAASNHQWWLKALDAATDDSYFGIAPTVTVDGKYYHPFVADFPFEAYSEGMKIYDIYKVDANAKAMVLREIEGTVPARVPVIVECSSPLATDNRIVIGTSDNMATVKGNLLKACWFDSDIEGHVNRTAYDPESMRVLSEVDGKLAYTKADIDFLPRNQAYMNLAGMKQKEVETYRVMTQKEYEEAVSVVEIIADGADVDVYSVDGTLVRASMPKKDVDTLPKGIYLLRAGEVTEKYLVK